MYMDTTESQGKREEFGCDIYMFGEWKKHWFLWILAMSANKINGFEEWSDRNGYKISKHTLSSRFAFVRKNHACGIYEWQIKKLENNGKVVYVGSTCVSKPGDFIDRIMQYCNNGSHISEYTEKALGKGYDLLVRVRGCGTQEDNEGNHTAAQ